VIAAREAFDGGCPLDVAIAQHISSAPEKEAAATTLQEGERIDWPTLVDRYQRHKINSGEAKASTWEKVWRPRMSELLAAMHRRQPPQNGRELMEAVTDRWALQPEAARCRCSRPPRCCAGRSTPN
jgi:hypothetical protein